MTAGLEARREVLKEIAVSVGRRWFDAQREDLMREGRPLAGGWPGTLSEARALVATSLLSLLPQRRMSTATSQELTSAARATYEEAKRAWLSSPERWRESEVGA